MAGRGRGRGARKPLGGEGRLPTFCGLAGPSELCPSSALGPASPLEIMQTDTRVGKVAACVSIQMHNLMQMSPQITKRAKGRLCSSFSARQTACSGFGWSGAQTVREIPEEAADTPGSTRAPN